jgi:hypothetical protein
MIIKLCKRVYVCMCVYKRPDFGVKRLAGLIEGFFGHQMARIAMPPSAGRGGVGFSAKARLGRPCAARV